MGWMSVWYLNPYPWQKLNDWNALCINMKLFVISQFIHTQPRRNTVTPQHQPLSNDCSHGLNFQVFSFFYYLRHHFSPWSPFVANGAMRRNKSGKISENYLESADFRLTFASWLRVITFRFKFHTLVFSSFCYFGLS